MMSTWQPAGNIPQPSLLASVPSTAFGRCIGHRRVPHPLMPPQSTVMGHMVAKPAAMVGWGQKQFQH